FVSATGYKLSDLYTVEVQHPDGRVVGTVTDVAPKDDGEGGGLGIIEVNHPGGYCWTTNTPDIRADDIVRIKDQTTGAVDESTVRNVTAARPVQTAPDTIQVHGTAQDALGNPLPEAQLEQRLVVASADPFAVNGRRTLRATDAGGVDGTLSYDAAGSTKWTATYTGLAQADIDRALGAESRGMWIDPALPSTESTIFENGAAAIAGPSAPCTAPLEKLPPPPGSETTPPSDVTGLSGSASNSTVTLNWSAATDNVGVTDYGIYRDGVAIATVQNADGSTNPPTTFTDQNVVAGQHTYTVDAGDAVGNRSVNMSNAVTVTTAVNPAVPATAPAPTGTRGLIGFPQRDFISATGYTPGVSYTFSVIRAGNVVSTSSPVVADSTGLAEVNHPGGACWTGMTPNIQPGDTIRISGGGLIEQTTVAGVTDERPIVTSVDPVTGGGTVQVHGTAVAPGGGQLPIDQIEQRLIANRDAFDINGRRTIRAGAGLDGTLSYDSATSTRWTATYTLQTPDDLARAVGGTSTSGASFPGAESRILWLGNVPASGNELTIYENGPGLAGGPAAGIGGCTSGPAEVPAPNVSLSAAPKFATTDVGSTSAAQNVTITNSGTAPLHLDRAYLAGLNPNDFVLTVPTGANGSVVDPGKSVTVTVAFKPTAAGTRQANLSFADDAANSTDQTLTLTGTTPAAPGPVSTAPIQSLAAVFNDPIQLFSPLNNSKLPVDFSWTNGGGTSELQMATGATTNSLGAFQPVNLADPTATSTRLYLTMGPVAGTAYQFRVRGCSAGVCGAWATGPAFTLAPSDDGNMAPGLFKGTWTTTAVAGSYGGTVKRASGSAQATIVPAVVFTVRGNAAWVSTLGPDQGLAQVQVDNGKPDVVDLYSATAQPRRVVWARDALPAGTHTVTVT
ncbi:MAG TPA: choice-of-anchor D domain-containing protein, partial [Kineosporiaceae bacterium]|nr:choice-of-anchor D domain-containing protein [Kineosporiaceae bacterium]